VAAALAGLFGVGSPVERVGTPPTAGDVRPETRPIAFDLLKLERGDRLDAWVVDAIYVPKPEAGDVAVRFVRGKDDATIFVARKGTTKFAPPVSTDLYDLFWSHSASIAPAEASDVVERLLGFAETRVRANERTTPVSSPPAAGTAPPRG
jgi:hypothetical protein